MKYITSLTILFAASAVFAQEITYDKIVSEDESLSSMSTNTKVLDGATLTLTGDTPNNWNLYIEKGGTVSLNSLLKWGTGSNTAPKSNSVDIYGNFFTNGKEIRLGDNEAGWETTFNVYDGGLLASNAEASSEFLISCFRGKNSIVNVFAGGEVKNAKISSFDRNNESSEKPNFEFNVDGGLAQITSVTLGNSAQSEKIQYSSINVTKGGTLTTSGNTILGNAALNDSTISVTGANSTWTSSGNISIGQNTDLARINVGDGGVITNNGQTYFQKGVLNVNEGGIYNAVGIVNMNQAGTAVNVSGQFNISNNLYISNGDIKVTNDGEYIVVNAAGHIIGNSGTGIANFVVDGATMYQNATNSDLYIYIGYASGAVANFKVTNDGLYTSGTGAKNTQLYMNAGTGTLEISDGGKWFANTNFYVGGASGANSTLILNNGKIAGTLGTNASSDMNIASASGSIGSVEVSNGGSAILRSFRMAQGGANAKATLIIKDAGSFVKATNTNDTNYLFSIGMNVADGDKYTGNSAIVEIHTGAQLANTAGGFSSIKDSAQMTFVLDSSNINYASTAMFSTKNLAVFKTDDTVSNPFVIDGANLGAVNGLTEGDIAEFVIMTVSGDATLNDDILDFTNTESIADIIEFKNNTNLEDWEDFGLDNLSFEDGNLVLSLTYVPEPSTYAAIFGALALAFAAYRRRK